MNERVKMVRKALGLTLEKFGMKIGLKRNSLSSIENGINSVTEQSIRLICREYNVNENWLRTGEGEMFIKQDRESDIAKLTVELLNEESDSFKNRLISVLANLTVEEWQELEKYANKIVNGK